MHAPQDDLDALSPEEIGYLVTSDGRGRHQTDPDEIGRKIEIDILDIFIDDSDIESVISMRREYGQVQLRQG
jgi:hypothetical protein